MTRKQAADYLGVSTTHVTRLKLAHTVIGGRHCYSRKTLDALMAERGWTRRRRRLVKPYRARGLAKEDEWPSG